jgi:hypothetical protein
MRSQAGGASIVALPTTLRHEPLLERYKPARFSSHKKRAPKIFVLAR